MSSSVIRFGSLRVCGAFLFLYLLNGDYCPSDVRQDSEAVREIAERGGNVPQGQRPDFLQSFGKRWVALNNYNFSDLEKFVENYLFVC